MRENDYQAGLIRRIRRRQPDFIILMNDASYLQGVPDLTIIFEEKWAWLETKASLSSRRQPNQQYYVDYADRFWFGAFICPENEREVLDDLEQAFGLSRPARFLKC